MMIILGSLESAIVDRLIEYFSLSVTAEALRVNIGSKYTISLQCGPVDPQFQVQAVAPTNHFLFQKTRLSHLSYGIKIWLDLSSVLSQCTRLTDGRTDSFFIARPCLHSMQRGKKAAVLCQRSDLLCNFLNSHQHILSYSVDQCLTMVRKMRQKSRNKIKTVQLR